MSKLIAFAALAVAAMPAVANPAFNVPAPGLLPLIGIGAVAVLVARRLRK